MSVTTTITPDPTYDPTADVVSDPIPDAAPVGDDPATEPDAYEGIRRSRGMLETDVKEITDLYVQGKLDLPEGAVALTPHFIGISIKKVGELEAVPSTGAIAAVLNRWEECGYAVLSEKPRGFATYTEEARTEGLAALKAKLKDSKKESRKAAAAATSAAEAAPVEAATNAA